jgi:septal ring factor EnvC (AmiA/AmiB activator)
MAWKSILIVFIGMCLFVSSCYPELSVQQYDKLKEDLEILDEQRTELKQEVNSLSTEVSSLSTELEEIKTKNTEVRAYVDFLVQLVSTQNSESLLEGEFDTEALVESKEMLLESAETLKDSQIEYYLSLINPENEAETVGVYYKVIEDCLKEIKQELAIKANGE